MKFIAFVLAAFLAYIPIAVAEECKSPEAVAAEILLNNPQAENAMVMNEVLTKSFISNLKALDPGVPDIVLQARRIDVYISADNPLAILIILFDDKNCFLVAGMLPIQLFAVALDGKNL